MTLTRGTVSVSHLEGTKVGYRMLASNPSSPTLLLIIPFTTTVDYYLPEFENQQLTERVNLIAIEPLGHGTTETRAQTITYWDSALAFLETLDALGIDQAFVMGTSQGGWIAARMALLAPSRVRGIILIGTSMDAESAASRELGCWDGCEATAALVQLSHDLSPMPDFVTGDGYSDFLMDIGYGKGVTQVLRKKWAESIRSIYSGDAGKRKICMAAVCISSRDGLHSRLPHIECPVLWMQGTDDVVFSVANAEKEIKLFKNAPEARLIPMQGGVHFLSFTHEKEIHQNILQFIGRWKST
ncbi:unnamed protein product [Penicillium pancosmium]